MLIDALEHPQYAGVFVTPTGEIFQRLVASLSHGGYHTVHIKHNGKSTTTIRRHTLVLETYKGPSLGRVARHGALGSSVDTVENLQWGTQRENCQDTIEHGKTTRGSRNANAKLTEASALEIYTRYHAGEGGSALAQEFQVSRPTVSDLATGRSWVHIHKANFEKSQRVYGHFQQPAHQASEET